jgi:hypothetical protein
MTLPGFTAEAGLERTRRQYRGQRRDAGGTVVGPAAPLTRIIPIRNICEIAPWLCGPQLSLSYQRPQGQGFPGYLTIDGASFATDVDVTLTICNCDLDPYRTTVHTSQDRYACLAVPPYTCYTIPGGSFTTTVPCYCGGGGTGIACGGPPVINQATVMVEAQDANGNSASGSTGNPC